MVKLGIYSENPDMSTRILLGPDQKIGKNLLCLMKQRRYAPFLPEFPCLHARKSRITILFSAYKQAGILQLIQYMQDDENNDWATLISAHHIDVATKYIMRLAKALRMAFILQFSMELSKESTATEELFNTLLNPHLCSEDQLGE